MNLYSIHSIFDGIFREKNLNTTSIRVITKNKTIDYINYGKFFVNSLTIQVWTGGTTCLEKY